MLPCTGHDTGCASQSRAEAGMTNIQDAGFQSPTERSQTKQCPETGVRPMLHHVQELLLSFHASQESSHPQFWLSLQHSESSSVFLELLRRIWRKQFYPHLEKSPVLAFPRPSFPPSHIPPSHHRTSLLSLPLTLYRIPPVLPATAPTPVGCLPAGLCPFSPLQIKQGPK